MLLRSAYDFDPTKDGLRFSELFNHAMELSAMDSVEKIGVRFLNPEALTRQELGRMVIVTGKYRSAGIQLQWYGPETIYEQLKKCGLDRILWVEPDSWQK